MVRMLYIFNKEYFNPIFFNFKFSKPGVAMFSLDSFPPWARIDSGALCAANTRFSNYKYSNTNTNTQIQIQIHKYKYTCLHAHPLPSLIETNTLEALLTTELPSPIVG